MVSSNGFCFYRVVVCMYCTGRLRHDMYGICFEPSATEFNQSVCDYIESMERAEPIRDSARKQFSVVVYGTQRNDDTPVLHNDFRARYGKKVFENFNSCLCNPKQWSVHMCGVRVVFTQSLPGAGNDSSDPIDRPVELKQNSIPPPIGVLPCIELIRFYRVL